MTLENIMRSLTADAHACIDQPTARQWNKLRVEITVKSDGWTLLMLSRIDKHPAEQELRDVLNALPYSLAGVPTVTPLVTQARHKYYVATMWQTVLSDRMES